ncbi:MAG TPA: hypothetical protein VLG50_06935 [Candidatus Saccharimonadales bacterium]|nr:hypothetical protein [Candidatus Saccharimonadales bacterium]
MKKQLLLALVVASTQLRSEWREHRGFLGGVLNTGEAIVESPAYLSSTYRENRRAERNARVADRDARVEIDSIDRENRHEARRDNRHYRRYESGCGCHHRVEHASCGHCHQRIERTSNCGHCHKIRPVKVKSNCGGCHKNREVEIENID